MSLYKMDTDLSLMARKSAHLFPLLFATSRETTTHTGMKTTWPGLVSKKNQPLCCQGRTTKQNKTHQKLIESKNKSTEVREEGRVLCCDQEIEDQSTTSPALFPGCVLYLLDDGGN